MHKTYKEIEEFDTEIIKTIKKALKDYTQNNQQYLTTFVGKQVSELVYDPTPSITKLFNDTLWAYNVIGNYGTIEQMVDYSTAINDAINGGYRIISNSPIEAQKQMILLCNQIDGLVATGDLTLDQAIKSVSKNAAPKITYSNGRRHPTKSYLKMLFKTNQRRLCEMRAEDIANQLGTKVYEYSSHSDPREACDGLQGKLVTHEKGLTRIKAGDGKIYPVLLLEAHGYGEASGPQGINCTHLMFPFVQGVSRLIKPKQDLIDAMAEDSKAWLKKDVIESVK